MVQLLPGSQIEREKRGLLDPGEDHTGVVGETGGGNLNATKELAAAAHQINALGPDGSGEAHRKKEKKRGGTGLTVAQP